MYEVLSPTGETGISEMPVVSRLSDLRNKTICEVINGTFKSQTVFPILRELLQKRYPGIRVIPYTEFPIQWVMGTTQDLLQQVHGAVTKMTQKGCDAVITGFGG